MNQLAKKKIEILNKNFLTIRNIQILMDCGKDLARKYRDKFVEKQGIDRKYFGTRIPTNEFIEFYKLNFDLIYTLATNGGDSNAART